LLRAKGLFGKVNPAIAPMCSSSVSGRADSLFQGKMPQSRKIESVRLRYYVDPATGAPHIYEHHIQENEGEEVLAKPIEDRVGSEGSRVALGQTEAGRYLRVIYVPDPEPDSAFVITGYDLGPKALKALRRRRRRKK
jgi:hypothetical protein